MSIRRVVFSLFFAIAALCAAAESCAQAVTTVFESRAPGSSGGGMGIGTDRLHGHSFRLVERTHITALGVDGLHLPAGKSVYVALYQIDTADSVPDVVNDSSLLATALIDGPVSVAAASAAVSLTVDPGIYAIVVGSGRHGATAEQLQADLYNTGTAKIEPSLGPYNVDYSTGARTVQSNTSRFFVEGQVLPAETPDPNAFLMETARPSAWWEQSSYPISPGGWWYASRFELTRPARIDQVGSWLRNGGGEIFAAIVELSGPDANPLPPSHPGFANSLRGTALIQTGSAPASYTGSFDELTLPAGHYALILGSGQFGASGSVGIMTVADQIVQPETLAWTGSFWGNGGIGVTFRMFLNGHLPDLAVSPDPVNFGAIPVGEVGEQLMTVTNLRDDADLKMTGVEVTNPFFALGFDVSNCSVTTLGPKQSCQFTILATPNARGPISAKLRVWNNGEPSPVIVDLDGAGVAPVIDLSPASLQFELLRGDQATGNLNLENIGDPGQELSWELDIAADSSCSEPAGLPWLNAATNNGGVAAGNSEAVTITADATGLAAGSYQAVLCISSNDPFSSLLTVPVSLEVTAPALAFDPDTLDFGPAEVGAAAVALTASLENSGDGDATGLDFSLSGDLDFTLSSNTCGDTLSFGDSCQVELSFLPGEFGNFSGLLVATNDQASSPAEMALIGSGFVPISPDANGILYVDNSVSGGNQSGDSWVNALPELKSALDWAADDWDPLTGDLQIWVAEGVYTPTDDPGELEASFVLVDGVAVYGGFAGVETSLDERDWANHSTVLSGRIGAANIQNVLIADNVGPTTRVDGFTVSGGRAVSLAGGIPALGGGIHMLNAEPIMSNLIFTDNHARAGGGAYMNASTPLFINVLFFDNHAQDHGGGGVFNLANSHSRFINCIFYANFANGAVLPTAEGGGMYNGGGSSPEIINSIFWANESDQGESQIFGPNDGGWNGFTNEARIAHSIIDGGMPEHTIDNGNNLFDDPLFVDASGANFKLERESPAVNAGDPATDLALFFGGPDDPLDLAVQPRVFPGIIETIDIGPFELQDDPPLPVLSFVPSELDFGEIELATGTATLQAELHNDGDADATVLDFTLSGAPDFSFSGENCGSELHAGQSCQVEISFLPAATGLSSGELALSGAEFTAQAELNFSGIGTQAGLELTPATLDFGEIVVTATSPTASVTLSSTGSAPLHIDSISATAAPFASSNGNCGPTPIELDPGQSCELGFTFSPTAIGEISAALTIESNAVSSPDSLQLSGQGVAALIDVNPASFVLTLPRGQNAVRDLNIENLGTLDLHWTITVESSCGAGPDIAWLTIDPASGNSAPQQSSSIGIGIASAGLAAGGHHAALCIVSNSLNQALVEIPLELQVTEAELAFDPATLDFGEVETDSTSAAMVLTLHNLGEADADELSFTVPESFSADTSACLPGLAAGTSCAISVRFAPTQTGAVHAVLTTSSTYAESTAAELTGTGIKPKPTEDLIFTDRFEQASPD